ncbi:MAG: hypothetical protein IJW59_03730 [Clostridia bacterium]|nr:hypothetical protein [Clostridia bacterium]
MSKSNICIVGLTKQLTETICRQLSIKLDMFYANVQDILEFELMDLLRVEQVCGHEYILKEERSVIKRVATYENTLINIQYSSLNNESSLAVVQENCLIIYLRLNEDRYVLELERENIQDNEKELNLAVFNDRDFICRKISDLTIDCLNMNEEQLETSIIEQILRFYS